MALAFVHAYCVLEHSEKFALAINGARGNTKPIETDAKDYSGNHYNYTTWNDQIKSIFVRM